MGDEIEMERRVTTVEVWQNNHEKVCAARWGLLIKIVLGGGALAMSTILALGGWSLSRLYDAQQQQNAALQQLIAHR